MIGESLIGAQLGVSIVSFGVIGYHCTYLDGQLNWQAITHCIIGRATKLSVVLSVICGMAQYIYLTIQLMYYTLTLPFQISFHIIHMFAFIFRLIYRFCTSHH